MDDFVSGQNIASVQGRTQTEPSPAVNPADSLNKTLRVGTSEVPLSSLTSVSFSSLLRWSLFSSCHPLHWPLCCMSLLVVSLWGWENREALRKNGTLFGVGDDTVRLQPWCGASFQGRLMRIMLQERWREKQPKRGEKKRGQTHRRAEGREAAMNRKGQAMSWLSDTAEREREGEDGGRLQAGQIRHFNSPCPPQSKK